MGQTSTNADAVLKEFYVDKVVEAIKQQMPALDYFKKRDDMPTDGRRVVYPIHIQRNSGVGARAESGNLPTPGNQAWVDLQISYKFNHCHIQLSAQAMKQSKTSRGAFEKLFDAEIMGGAKDSGRDRNRQLWGDGLGILAQVNGQIVASTTVAVNNGQHVTSSPNSARFFAAGMLVAFINPANGALDATAGIQTVASVAANLQSFTTALAFSTTTANCWIVRASTLSDAVGSTAYNNEIMGFLGHVDDGTYVNTYHGINRTTYPITKSSRLSLAGGSLSLDTMQKATDIVNQVSNGKVKVWFMHHTTQREHLNNLSTFKRYVDEFALSPDGGWKGGAMDGEIEFNQAPIIVDRDCPYSTVFGVDEDFLIRYVLEEGKWADEDGTVLLRLSGSDDYEARFRVFDNFVYENPNTGIVIDGIGLAAAPELIQVI